MQRIRGVDCDHTRGTASTPGWYRCASQVTSNAGIEKVTAIEKLVIHGDFDVDDLRRVATLSNLRALLETVAPSTRGSPKGETRSGPSAKPAESTMRRDHAVFAATLGKRAQPPTARKRLIAAMTPAAADQRSTQ